MEDQSFTRVHVLDNRFEADLLMAALEQEGIPAMLRSFEETPYDGLFVPQKGWGLILVAEDDLDRARRLIQEILQDLKARKLYDDPSEVDDLLWERLRQADPDTIRQRAQVSFDAVRGGYRVPFLNGAYCCAPERRALEIIEAPPSERLDFQLALVILHYLLEAQSTPLAGTWIGEKDIPGGSLFFRGPHAFPTDRLLQRCGSHRDLFARAMEALGGAQVDLGDAAYRLWVLPRVPVLFILWEGDDEFPPELNIRFDASIQDHLHALDTIWAMINLVCRNIAVALDPAEETD